MAISTVDQLDAPILETLPPVFIDEDIRPILIDPPGPKPFINKIIGTERNDVLATTKFNDHVTALGGNDFIIGSRGNDTIDGGKGFDTVSYAQLSGPIRLGATGTVNKGALGFDQLIGVESIQASLGSGDIIDGSAGGSASINVNLSANTLGVSNIPGIPNGLQFTVTNFEDVLGTQNNDVITGNRGNNSLNGGAGDDIITGTVRQGALPNSNEIDILTGGSGNDTFVLASGSTLFYNGGGFNDFARITDFAFGADRIDLGEGNYQFSEDLTQLFAVNGEVLDLIANISFAGYTGAKYDGALGDLSTDLSLESLGGKTFSFAEGQALGLLV
jgi:Ca2+-binding RTX toxin-like protein